MWNLRELFCAVDDFCRTFEPRWHRQLGTRGARRRFRPCHLCLSEVMTILIAFPRPDRKPFQLRVIRRGRIS